MREHEKWLSFALEDLGVAKTILKQEFFSTVAYHCQQSAEKALKGYLVFRKQEILRTHDLIKLTGICVKFDRSFEKIYDTVEQLNPFATKFRYPSEHDIPDRADAQLAIKQAQLIMKFVIKRIAESDTGQTEIFTDQLSDKSD